MREMKKSQITPIAIIVAAIVILATFVYLIKSEEQVPYDGDDGTGDDNTSTGDWGDTTTLPVAPDFTLPLVDGGGSLFSLSDQRGKVIVIDFFATWCGPCTTQISHLKDLSDHYSASKVMIVSVDVDNSEGEDLLSIYKEQKGITWDVVRNGGGIAREVGYEVESIPTMVIVDQQGRLVFRKVGVTSSSELQTQINKLL